MSSSVFFKFKSSKEPQRITFDGTGISVFELKREIITATGLGDGSDFDLSIYTDDSNEEYDDDTTIVPRSTTVLARRLPAARPGHGRAARYVSGKAPVTAKNSYRTESSTTKPAIQAKPAADGAATMSAAQTEEERIAAMFAAGAENWEQQKAKMADAKPVYRPGRRPHNVPEGEPPDTYICHRCHVKGHWIQACPTNDDPNFENKPRIKRTTGIPRSMLQTIEKPVALTNDGLTDDSRQPSGVMVNAAGEYVIAKPDEASWNKFQAKAQASAAQQEVASAGSKELRDRGLECSIDKRMLVDPMKTPCCGMTYCNDCIENALINSDFVCPNCSKEGVLIDDLVADEDTIAKIKEFEDDKRKAKEASKSPKPEKAEMADSTEDKKDDSAKSPEVKDAKPASPSAAKPGPDAPVSAPAGPAAANGVSKKRPADEDLKNERIPTAPAAMRKQQEQMKVSAPSNSDQAFVNQMNALAGGGGGGGGGAMMSQQFANGNFMPFNGMGGMGGFPNQNGMMGMGMSMGPMMNMPQAMMNPMMMQNGGWGNMGGMGYQQNGMYGNNYNSMGSGVGQNWQGGQGWAMNGMGQGQMQNGKTGVFPNQQRTVFSEPFPNEEDNAYFRKPVNPHRHQNRNRRNRAPDYTQL
ncbi:Protein mpe1 [Diplodia intermedia]|uniref:Protein mpe1 n=1 Tax=Diplodia intermedia TaxID=856260 RepID=A0ABR3TL65_9PEZI